VNTFGAWQEHDVEQHNAKVARMKTAKAHNLEAGVGEVELMSDKRGTIPDNEIKQALVSSPESKGSSARPARPSFTIRPTTDEERLNKTERLFLHYLRAQTNAPVGIQSLTFKLGDDCRYTPDFHVPWMPADGFTCYEVKGFWRDDARVKIKVAARMFPWAKFIAVQRIKGQWKFEEIKP